MTKGDSRPVQDLRSPDPELRRAAVCALGQRGSPRTVPRLIEALRDPELQVRCEAARALGAIGDPRAAAALVEGLGDPDPEYRQAVAEALVQMGKAAIPLVARVLGYSNPLAREAAARVLGAHRDRRAAGALVQALGDRDEQVGTVAAESVVAQGAAAVPALLDALRAWEDRLRAAAIAALARIGEPAVDPLVAAIQQPGYLGPPEAADALARMGAPAARALPALRALLQEGLERDAAFYCRRAMQGIERALRTVPIELEAAPAPAGRGTELEAAPATPPSGAEREA